jgi:MFS transporter, DHA1 family, multidrug resistance protein
MKHTISKSMLLITIILMDILAGMELDLFVPSFPELQDHFNLSPFWVESLLSVNFIGFCLSLFFVGGFADRYGRKPIILLGLATFIIGSILCLWALSFQLLLLGRFLQGIGIAAPAILSFLIITDTYPIKKQQHFTALLNGFMNVSVGFAPVIGSYITLYFHWQGNFTALLLLGLVTFLMTLIFIPISKPTGPKESISWRGYIPIFKSKPLLFLIMCFIFFFVPYWIFVGMSPILYMEDLGVSLSHFGYYQGALALVFGLGSIFYGFIIHKYDQRKMLYLSCLMMIIALVLIVFVVAFDSRDPLLITLAFLPFCIGQIIPTTILYPLCINFIPQAKGRVSALIQGTRLILSAFGLQCAGYFYQGSFQHIGIILVVFIFMTVIMLFFAINNSKIINFSKELDII